MPEVTQEVTKEVSNLQAYIDKVLPGILDFLFTVVLAVVILLIGMKLINTFIKFLKNSLDRGNVEMGVATFLCSLCRYALYFILVLVILSQFGVTASSVIAVLGSAGLTLGLALQGSLSNFAGGVLILLLKPFVVGDYIIENSSNQEGTVAEITIFYTKILTVDNKAIMIPNGTLSNTSIVNASAMDKRRLDLLVGVSYDSDIPTVKAVLEKVALEDEARLANEQGNVFVSELADSSIIMGARLWVKNEDYWTAKWRITENIKYAFDEHGIEIPFPQMDVNVKQ
uniref:mechanosensitive ion channel family protein n=1 Tax=Agathobacter sp. TaxID=2021311 RepID=UPI004057822D